MIPVRVVGSKTYKEIYALLDEGSTITIINSNIVKYVGAETNFTNVALRGIGHSEPVIIAREEARLKIESSTYSGVLTNILVVKDLALPSQTLSKELCNLCEKKTKIKVLPYQTSPDILIGQDYCNLIMTRDFRDFNENLFTLSYCLLGWTIHGRVQQNLTETSIFTVFNENTYTKSDYNLENMVRQYFDLDALGVSTVPRVNANDEHALKILEDTSCLINGRWEVGLLWKDENFSLPNSRLNALNRLYLLERKLDRNPQYANLYYKEMNRLLELGFAKKTDSPPKNPIWYLPHFGVTNINKPGKVRLVFDAAAKSNKVSFNDFLLRGPDLLENLLGVIMRFRQNLIAIKGDMRDMFLKIKICEKDQDAQRFLWRANDRSSEPREYVMTSLLFGAKSSPATALFIKNKNAKSFIDQYPKTVESVIHNFYMDDYLDSCESVEEAENRIRQVVQINEAANWEMHGWASNEPRALQSICENEQTPISLGEIEGKEERILGLQWLTHSDVLVFKFGSNKISFDLLSGQKKPTKREFLSVIMSIFDPLGFLAPFTIQSRILMQKIWQSEISWDESLRDTEFENWKRWLCELKTIETCKVPRCYQIRGYQIKFIELHTFSDASSKAYAAVAYWRFILSNNKIHTSFIMSKSRVSPIKPVTIPRLELQAAVLAVRVAKLVSKEHSFKIDRRTFWSDSETVLKWIHSDPLTYNTYVMNRLGEICDESKVSEWKWVSTENNPADDATRLAPKALENNSRWFLGPSFLCKHDSQWPIQKYSLCKDSSIDCIEKKRVLCTATKTFTFSPYLPDYSRFSSWIKLIRATSRVLEAIDIWLGEKDKYSDIERQDYAEKLWVREIQVVSFEKEIKDLKSSNAISRKSRLITLNPIIDNQNLLRVNGRVKYLPESREKFQPLILDGKQPVTQLLVKKYHEQFFHKGSETVLNELRQNFWILGVRKILRKIIKNCGICKILRALPPNPKMANLPSPRLGYRFRPFTHCGLDYFGPMMVKIGRRREKRWDALFTCMTTRAIHIELVHSLSTDSAIMAIQRFAARRAFPQIIYSDNGTNFKGASKELREAIASIEKNVQLEYALRNNFVWNFNPPTASHMGGAWERMIRIVKETLVVILKEQAPSDETLLTLLAEVEHSVNSRPLTHVSVDPLDNEALTPNHFLFGTSSGTIRLAKYDEQSACPRKHWRLAQYFADAFWRRWLRDYLPTLVIRKKWFNTDCTLKPGDLVLVMDNQLPRNVWKKAVIVETFPGRDNEVRVAKIKTATGNLIRPTRKLVKFSDVQIA